MRRQAIVLGIGNILWADEGFGVRAVEALNAGWRAGHDVRVVDGGTQGLALLPVVEDADFLVILDAVDFGLPPGTLMTAIDDEVPRYLTAKKLSLHQTSFQDVLALAQLRGSAPARMVLIGVQPLDLDSYGGGLSPPVAAQVSAAATLARQHLAAAGHLMTRRLPGDVAQPLGPDAVAATAARAADIANAAPEVS